MEYVLVAIVGFLAFFLKGLTGTGSATVIVALCSLIIEPKAAIVLASFINIFGGLAMIKVDPIPLNSNYWIPITVTMVIGSIFGAISLKIIDKDVLEIILGAAFLIISLWFILTKSPTLEKMQKKAASFVDIVVGSLAGFCGGFIGVNAPILISHFGRHLDKQHLRRLLVLIFIPAAMAQTMTFLINGLLTKQIIFYALLVSPGMALGIYLGNRAHYKISETWFRRGLGVFLLIVSARLIF